MLNTQKVPLKKICIYYAAIFSKRSSLFLPLIALLTTLTLLCSFKQKNELFALRVGGISLLRLVCPFLMVAGLFVMVNYLNSEYLLPSAYAFIERFETDHSRANKRQKETGNQVHVLPLEDDTCLIYQKYHTHAKELFDVYWLQTAQRIWHIDTLSLQKDPPRGYQVDTFFRSGEGVLEKGPSYKEYPFTKLRCGLSQKESIAMENSIEGQSISALIKWQKNCPFVWKKQKSAILTHLYFKAVIPWFSLLVVLGVVPYATRFSRSIPLFFLFALGIFGYIILLAMMEAAVILGENHVFPPFWTVCTIPLALALFFGKKLFKLDSLQ